MVETFGQFSAMVIWTVMASYLFKHVKLPPKLDREIEELRIGMNF